jgi:hypothetical protein
MLPIQYNLLHTQEPKIIKQINNNSSFKEDMKREKSFQ